MTTTAIIFMIAAWVIILGAAFLAMKKILSAQ